MRVRFRDCASRLLLLIIIICALLLPLLLLTMTMMANGAKRSRLGGGGGGARKAAWRCSLGLLLFTPCYIALQVKENRRTDRTLQFGDAIRAEICKLLPTRRLTILSKSVMEVESPRFLTLFCMATFKFVYGVDLQDCPRKSLRDYQSVQDLFSRKLEPSARKSADSNLVSPCDGILVGCGKLLESDRIRVKNQNFTLASLLKINPNTTARDLLTKKDNSTSLYYSIIYLAPGDYHHFHSPCNWQVKDRRHVYENLFWFADNRVPLLRNSIAHNERVIYQGNWRDGSYFCFIPVGALLVGTIKVGFDSTLGNHPLCIEHKRFGDNEKGITLKKSEHIGNFLFGSTCVLIFEDSSDFKFRSTPGTRLRVGEAL